MEVEKLGRPKGEGKGPLKWLPEDMRGAASRGGTGPGQQKATPRPTPNSTRSGQDAGGIEIIGKRLRKRPGMLLKKKPLKRDDGTDQNSG